MDGRPGGTVKIVRGGVCCNTTFPFPKAQGVRCRRVLVQSVGQLGAGLASGAVGGVSPADAHRYIAIAGHT